MKINTFQLIATLIAICFLFGMMSSSQAGEITSMSADNGASGCYMSLTADEDIMYIDWYVKQMHPHTEADNDYEHVHTSMHSHGTRSVYVNICYLEGHIKIANYDIKAEVCFGLHDFDTATTSVDVRKTIHDTGYKKTGAYGSSRLFAHYFNGSAIVMDGDARVYNGTKVARGVFVTGRFRHTNQADPQNPKEKELPAQVIGEGQSASYTTNDWGAGFFDFPTTLEEDEDPWNCDTYLRIEATAVGKKDDWFAGVPNTFDWRDRR